MNSSTVAGTSLLVRLAVRRDRVLAPIWVLVLLGVCYASAAATSSLYPTVTEQVAASESINATPAIVALYGPILDVRSLGDLAMTKMTVLYAVFVAALFVVLVRRHTRTDEEGGQTELLGGTAVGRHAPLAAAVLESALIAVALGILTAMVNVAGGLPVTGSIAFGASWCGIGVVAAGVSAVACQVSASARTCGGVAAGALGIAYALRAVGDTSAGWLSWLSPFGWSTQLRAYSDPRWWVLGLYLFLGAALLGLAQLLRTRRDLGSGLVAARPGPAAASPRLGGAISLALRTNGPTVATWTVATAAMGTVLGAIVPNISGLLDSDSARAMMARLGGQGGVERSLVAAELSIVAVAVTCFGIAVIGHGAADEQAGRAELVLATATSRARTFAATMLVAFVGSVWLLLITGTAIGLGYGSFGDVLPAALAQVPAVWITLAIAAAAFAARPTWAVVGWVVVTLFVTLGQIGELLDLPAWVLGLSPYTLTPSMPVEDFTITPELTMAVIAVGLLGAAWMRYRVRDIS